jgi:hypothetical protein
LLFIVSGQVLLVKKIKEQGFLRNLTNNISLGSEIRDPEKIHPGSGSRVQGVKKHRIRIRNTALKFERS